ncbi:MCP four helix bundle domain-containing protein [Marinicrinis lubricantis]|uniref:MCP four helix bundle domain-containing protein n=1 Tax=Marinicrinis lubricantis TaxID=2086470 RepID=A0ABW1ITS8_9BACL
MNFFRNMKLFNKILSLVMLSIVMLFLVGAVGYTYTSNMASSAKDMYENGFYPLESLSVIDSNTRGIRGDMFELMIIKDPVRNRELEDSINSRIEENSGGSEGAGSRPIRR